MVRRTVLVVSCVAVLASGCTTSGATKTQSSASAAASTTAAQASTGAAPAVQQAALKVGPALDTVLGQVSADGSVSTATALQAFSLVFGQLPGVTLPAGGGGILPDGTGPMRWLLGHWKDLTAAQRAAALPLLPQPQTAAAPTSHALGEGRTLTFTDVDHKPVQQYPRQRTDSYYTDAANQAAADIAAKVGRPLGIPITARDNGRHTNYYAVTGVLDASGGYVGAPATCQIDLSEQGDQLSDVDLERVLHHEVWHCYEGVVIGLAAYWSASAPQWIIEGEAEWVGTTSSPTAPLDSDFWPDYLSAPATPLFRRSYDAEGFYGQLQQSGTDMWSHLIPILQASGNPAAFEAAGGTGDPLLDSWAAGFFRDPSRGSDWDIVGPGVTSTKSPQSAIDVPVDATVTAKAAPYADAIFSVVPGDADLERFTFSGHARVSDAGGHDYKVDGGALLACVNPKGCTCPDNAESPPSQPLSAFPIDLAVTGDPSGDTGTVHGESLQEACSCGSNGTAVPAGTYTGPVTGVITTDLRISGSLISEGSGSQTANGTITLVSDGTKVTGRIKAGGSGSSHVGLAGSLQIEDSAFGTMDGTISGPAANPIASGTLSGHDEVNGEMSAPFSAGLHLTKISCGAISGDLVAMFAEIEKPNAKYLTIGGHAGWTATRTK